MSEDLSPHLVREAAGTNSSLIVADVALDLAPTRRRRAAISLVYAPATSRLTCADAAPALGGQPWLKRMVWEKQAGDHVTLPSYGDLDTGRVAHLVATVTTAEICLQRLAAANPLRTTIG
ncbi:hypothetical protein ACFC58_03445 [Kitasatospora purpeofusca]|uniref:hypothetical protein n=1 Tax=Kitasatospora purpeofusca TaxID=67352 RepID=UPI0035E34940